MKLIVGTDFSENARAAGITAAALAGRWSDTLALAHVLDESMSQRLPEEVRETLAASTNDRLHSEAVDFGSQGVKVEEHMLSGAPEQALADLATRSDARLLIVSSLGHRPGEWLLGSVAERTADFSPVPTLVVRSAAPFEAWTRGERPLKVFVAVDFSDASDKALQWVKHLISAGPCDVVLGYVDSPLGERSRLGLGWDAVERENPPEVQAILKRELRERAETVLGKVDLGVPIRPELGPARHPSGRNGVRGRGRPSRRRHTSTPWRQSALASLHLESAVALCPDERALRPSNLCGSDSSTQCSDSPGARCS